MFLHNISHFFYLVGDFSCTLFSTESNNVRRKAHHFIEYHTLNLFFQEKIWQQVISYPEIANLGNR